MAAVMTPPLAVKVTLGGEAGDTKSSAASRFGLSCMRATSQEVSTPTGKESGELRLRVEVVSSAPGVLAAPPQAETKRERQGRAKKEVRSRR